VYDSKAKKQNWWPALIMMIILAVAALVRDIWMLWHHQSFGGGIPLLLPLALGAFIAMIWTIKKHDERQP